MGTNTQSVNEDIYLKLTDADGYVGPFQPGSIGKVIVFDEYMDIFHEGQTTLIQPISPSIQGLIVACVVYDGPSVFDRLTKPTLNMFGKEIDLPQTLNCATFFLIKKADGTFDRLAGGAKGYFVRVSKNFGDIA